MHRYARSAGIVITAIGVAILLSFSYYAYGRLGDVQKAQLYRQRNPGNAMYDAQFFVAASELVFLAGGAVSGVLLTVNGLTWIALGAVVRRFERGERVP